MCLLSSWEDGYCYTADDGNAMEIAIKAVAQKHLYGETRLDNEQTIADLLAEFRFRSDFAQTLKDKYDG